ncbi:MAG: endonuclease [Bacilli bacterium]|nr:endonuclease [Bacilli bacterium]
MKILIVIVVLFGLLLLFLTLTEYRPEEREEVSVTGEVHRSLQIGESFSFLTWNVGYGALGEDADFFMDGGKKVKTADRNQVNHNIFSIRNKIEELSPTFFLLQEVDTSSTRDNHMNEYSSFKNYFTNYQSSFAYNFKVLYVPYPIPPIGNVNSGIATFSKFKVSSSERVQLPSSFIWPVSTANLKRCVLISRIPIENSDKELVIMNLHLEAYDKGKGKEEQTKALKKLLKAELKKGNYVIAGGDFNQVFSSLPKEKKKVKDGLWKPGVIDISSFDDGWLFYMDEKTPSCRSLDQPYKGADPEKFQYYYIDGYIVSNNISIESVETKDYSFANSDHNPVLIKGIINQ